MIRNRPQKAATVILARPRADSGIEVFMTRRLPEMNFLGGMYVFPGGAVGKKDCSEGSLKLCYGLSRLEAQRILGMELSPEEALGHWVAAVRELFEEVGVLVCVREQGRPLSVSDAGTRERLKEKRKAVIGGSIDFRSFLESEGLLCDARGLVYFSHWVTPEEFPRRFDTRFYLAALPEGQTPLATSEEVTESLWVVPDQALELCQRGRLPVIFPTYASLRTLADFDSLESLLAEYRSR